ncbi:YrdB family protein [Rhizobiaceae sp. 2RAB30]
MASAWWNLTLRFLLEVAALFGFGLAGWRLGDSSFWRWPFALSPPVTAAVLWGAFAVPGDPSRSGAAPIPVSGGARLLLELLVFCGGAAAYWIASHMAALALVILVAIHFALSVDRIDWLLRQQTPQ